MEHQSVGSLMAGLDRRREPGPAKSLKTEQDGECQDPKQTYPGLESVKAGSPFIVSIFCLYRVEEGGGDFW